MKNGSKPEAGVIVFGGGLAGLAAATYLARAGRAVTLFERSKELGGRAITNKQGEFSFNLGPHALYRKGAGARVLKELGVSWKGKLAPLSGYASRGGELHYVSYNPWWFVSSRMISLGAKMEAGRLLASIRTMDTHKFDGITLGEWLDTKVRRPQVRQLVSALGRVATYANDTERMSAGLALSQLQLANHGVYYLDGGWQTLVDGLRDAATAAGVRIESDANVTAIDHDGAVRGVRLADGSTRSASAVIVAASPQIAAGLVEGNAAVRQYAADAAPVRAACLDIGLRRLTRPKVNFVLGLDTPTYYSVHSLTARLAPEGQAMIHIAKYLAMDDRSDPKQAERELELILDLAQPGWRDELIERRYLPNMTVVNDVARADRGGQPGRPAAEVPGVSSLYLAGDWIGPEGWLVDAVLASAKQAAELVLERPATAGRSAVGAPGRAG
jgi:phytoene dehydrogenase-like protein